KAVCAPSEGVSGICDVPFSPWQAKQVGRRASRDCAQSGDRAEPARMAPIARLRMSFSGRRENAGGARSRAGGPPSTSSAVLATGGRPLGPVTHPVDRAVVVVGDQQRAVLHHQHSGRPSNIIVVLEEAGNERLHRPEGAVRLELHQDKITSDLGAAIPGAMARQDDLVAVGGREHGAGVEAHSQNSSHECPQPNSWSGMLPWWQYGKPKLSFPGLARRLSLSCGRSSENQSRWFSVK